MTWEKDKDGLVADHWVDFRDPEGWYYAQVRWDGCIHFNRLFNEPLVGKIGAREDDVDYLHICDIDDLITRLQELKAVALQHFGKDWPDD